MYFRSRPHPSLAEHINYYWFVSDVPRDEKVHIIPSGTLEVVFNLHSDEFRINDPGEPTKFSRYSGAVVSGAHSHYFVIEVQAYATIMGVHFKPGGAFALLGVPPGSLTDEHANLDAVWGTRASELRERLATVNSLAARFAILDGEFTQRLGSAAHSRAEVKFALRQLLKAKARVERVAADVDLSHRRLIEIFAAEVGVSPKVFSRVGRFQRALNLAKQGESADWTQLALMCGYFDQSHLIREFVTLSGLSPTELLERSAAMEGHHAALAAKRR